MTTEWSIEGPVYADRLNGKLTFSDWASWTPEDQGRWQLEFSRRNPTEYQRLNFGPELP